MKTLHQFTIVAAFLGPSISAASTRGRQVTITLLNEIDRHSGEASIPADGRFRKVQDLFATTDLDQNGQFFGTSARLTQFHDDTHCLICGIEGDILLNSSVPLADLDGNPNVALLKPLVLNGLQIRCST
ncbi:hypothetical protein HBH98_247130 [Parastagonospora nodorum]|nr:hypothetical protein HBH53_251100 [Parastagonospora nodorum]KAH3956143.1 hypothetical protein HBH51_251750 [Parastagonospora nodorum]KAH4215397.1 hypothetical protein HBI06_253430 [Parastagonospora nodorum]KAH4223088.1 hypothetical protein HBI05_249170 [Parastagonospora nodorum]KAH4333546.1 hypothetical protein HBH98_247130 [Parastagonospora nodorum]